MAAVQILVFTVIDLTGADGRKSSICGGIDAFAYETNTAITQGELSTANVPTGESVVVWPVANALGHLQYSVERNCAGCRTSVGIVPPVPLAPARQSFTDDERV